MQMLKRLFAPKLNSLSFTDWVNRINDALTNSYEEVRKSDKEDTFENVLEAFKKNSFNLLNGIDGVDVFVDIYGVFLYNEFSDKKVYLLSFNKDGRFANLPTDESFTRVTAKKHLSKILVEEYNHQLRKLSNTQARLASEMKEAKELTMVITNRIMRVGVKTAELSGPHKFDTLESYFERSTKGQTPEAGVGSEKVVKVVLKPVAKKKAPAKKSGKSKK